MTQFVFIPFLASLGNAITFRKIPFVFALPNKAKAIIETVAIVVIVGFWQNHNNSDTVCFNTFLGFLE